MRLTSRHFTLEDGRREWVVGEGVADAAARLPAVVRHLPAEDRRLIELLIVRGLSQRAAAAELHIPAGVVARRIQRVRRLLASPTVRAIADHADSLAPDVRQLAIDHYFSRIAISVLCQRAQMTRRAVQAHLDYVRGWARALHRAEFRAREAARERLDAADDQD